MDLVRIVWCICFEVLVLWNCVNPEGGCLHLKFILFRTALEHMNRCTLRYPIIDNIGDGAGARTKFLIFLCMVWQLCLDLIVMAPWFCEVQVFQVIVDTIVVHASVDTSATSDFIITLLLLLSSFCFSPTELVTVSLIHMGPGREN